MHRDWKQNSPFHGDRLYAYARSGTHGEPGIALALWVIPKVL